MTLVLWLAAAALGGCGSVARFLLDGAVSRRISRDFPYGTLVVNLTGAVLLGLLAGLALPPPADELVGTAAIGAYTTYATWMLETQRLAEQGELALAIVNLLLSLALGLGAAALGRVIGAAL